MAFTDGSLIEGFLNDSALGADAITDLTLERVMIAGALGSVFFLIAFGWNYVSGAVSGEGLDKQKLMTNGILLAAIALYIPIMGMVNGLGDIINQSAFLSEQQQLETLAAKKQLLNMTTMDQREKDEYNDNVNNSAQSELDAKEQHAWYDMTTLLSEIGTYMEAMASEMLTGVARIITLLLKIIIKAISINLTKLLYILGPLFFAFAILFKGALGAWFKTYATCYIVSNTLSTLDQVLAVMWTHNINVQLSGGAIETSMMADLALNCTIIVLYILAFWITGKYFQAVDAGKALSTAAGVALAAVTTGGAGAGAAVGGGGATGGGSTASELGSIAKGAQNVGD